MMRILTVLVFFLLNVIVCVAKPREGKDLTANEFAKMIKEKNIVLVDVRTASEFEDAHLESAILIDFFDPNFKQNISSLSKKRTICVYCRSGNRSGKTMKLLADLGYKHVINLAGGIKGWKAEGLETVESQN
ncbi:rhodanese-like domain-containing protein [Puteibacter caeruleilacunae]|nr:rhodanese-like domain-containing protein [Puteibacter caeruleilacunae]